MLLYVACIAALIIPIVTTLYMSRNVRAFTRRLMAEDSGEAVILTWNVTNWITIILMAAIGFFLIGLGMKFYQSRTASS